MTRRIGAPLWIGATLAFLALVLVRPSGAQSPSSRDRSPHSHLTVIAGLRAVAPGQKLTMVLRLQLDPGWHSYWVNPGDAGLPLRVTWRLPKGASAGPVQLPTPRRVPQPPLVSYGYEGETLFLVDVHVPTTSTVGASFRVSATAEWLACADVCLPADADIAFSLPVLNVADAQRDSTGERLIATARSRMPREAAEWRARAAVTTTGYRLEFVSRSAVAPKMPHPYFFVDSVGVIDHVKRQRVTRTGNIIRLDLARSEFATTTVLRLHGVLVADTSVRPAVGWRVWATVTGRDGSLAGPRSSLRGIAIERPLR